MRRVLQRWINLILASTTFCLAKNGSPKSFTFFKEGTALPGPSMSFGKSLGDGVFEFQFKTFVDRALLLYQDDRGLSNYVSLEIDKGRVHLSSETNVDGFSKRTETSFDDFEWHTVRIGRSPSGLKLALDEKIAVDQAMNSRLTLSSKLQLGGFTEERSRQSSMIADDGAWQIYVRPLSWRGFFLGCVRNIKYGSNESSLAPVDDIRNLRSFVNEGSCDLTLCDKRRKKKPPGICENGGVCKPTGESSAFCDCRWSGYRGTTCTDEALRLILNGLYKVTYKRRTPIPLGVMQEQFTLRIRSARNSAIILVAGAANGTSHKLTLEIKDSKFVVTFNTGDDQGDVVLRSDETVSDNEWHFVRYRRNGSILSLAVDRNELNFTLSKSDSSMNYNNVDLYIGDDSNPRNRTVEVEDFIWEYHDQEVNFVQELFDSFAIGSSKDEYTVIPSGVTPVFNLELPSNVATQETETNLPRLTTASTDVNDCTKECHANAYCNKTEPSAPSCTCKSGYSGDGRYNCTDNDECNSSAEGPCHKHAQCSNTNGSYYCKCEQGYYGDGHFNCSDVDECSQTTTPCFANGQCENSVGSYSCICPSGLTGDGKQNCADIDECSGSSDVCGEHAQCRNAEGTYHCHCKSGYTGGGHKKCTDINECAEDSSVCHPQATCTNALGSYTCKCLDKYHGDGVKSCLLNDPCDAMPCFSKKSKLVLKNEEWSSELTNKLSVKYKTLATKLIEKIRKVYEKHPQFVHAFITKFRKGSVVAEFELMFTKDVEDPFKLLQEAISDRKMGDVTVEIKQPVENESSEKNRILGLNRTIFICVVALAAGICIVCVTMLIFVVIARRSRRRNAQITKGKQEESLHATEPQGLLYKNSVEEVNGQCIT